MKESLFLFFYSIFKAFLPLPSLEVVLLPLHLQRLDLMWWYSFIGASGTFVGGSIGYLLATIIKEDKWIAFFTEKTWKKGKDFVSKYGVLAVFIGGVTPIPDFLLAYVAGFVRMHYFAFAISDGIARFLRSVFILYLFTKLGILVDMDRYGLYIIYALLFYIVVKYVLNYFQKRKQ